MSKPKPLQILTANHLTRGDVIYWSGHKWSNDPASALLFCSEERAKEALNQVPHAIAVGPYLAPAEAIDGKARPLHFREIFRSLGPSNYRHGKQQEARHV